MKAVQIKLFKNFKTKKQLREENAIFQARLDMALRPVPHLQAERYFPLKVEAHFLDDGREEIPEDYIKNELLHNLFEQIKPQIKYWTENRGFEKVYHANLQILRKQ